METYKESVKKWENFIISDADTIINLMQAYKDSYLKISYDFLLQKEVELIKKICEGKTTFDKVFTVYYFLLWNGFFSNERCFKFERPCHYINQKAGISIICGEGVCVSIAAHLCDILRRITGEHFTYLVGMHIDENNAWNANHPQIEKKCANIVVSNPEILLNHANVLIMDNNEIYILDPTNFLIYKEIKNSKNNSHLTRIELRFNIDLDSSYTDAAQLRNAANKLKKFNDVLASREYKQYNAEVLSSILNDGINMCHNHMKEIIEFRQECDYIYKCMDLGMTNFSTQIKNKAKKLEPNSFL